MASSFMVCQTSDTLSSEGSIDRLTNALGVDFILTGSLRLTAGCLGVEVLLQRMCDRRYVWASESSREIEPASLIAVRQDIAANIARILGQRYGVIFSHSRDNTGHPPADFRHYLRSSTSTTTGANSTRRSTSSVRTGARAGRRRGSEVRRGIRLPVAPLHECGPLRIRSQFGVTAAPLARAAELAQSKPSGLRRVRARRSSRRGSRAGSARTWAAPWRP